MSAEPTYYFVDAHPYWLVLDRVSRLHHTILKHTSQYIDGPYIFTIPFFGRSKGSLTRLSILSATSQEMCFNMAPRREPTFSHLIGTTWSLPEATLTIFCSSVGIRLTILKHTGEYCPHKLPIIAGYWITGLTLQASMCFNMVSSPPILGLDQYRLQSILPLSPGKPQDQPYFNTLLNNRQSS
jgi:hypothetical protein